jgi:hypothetical protein
MAVQIGAERLAPTLQGHWPHASYPRFVWVMGRAFRRAGWYWPYRGVVAQYREYKKIDSMHLFVLEDGSWVIPHIDETNPDLAGIFGHLMNDVVRRPAFGLGEPS